jgi:predicted amidophosphoribosyltransferase
MSAFKCPKCGTSTGGNEKFCFLCGQPLNGDFPTCGETWRFLADYRLFPGFVINMTKEELKITYRKKSSQSHKIKKGRFFEVMGHRLNIC